MKSFIRYCVIRTKDEKTLTVKRYDDPKEYNKEIHLMTSVFEDYNSAVRECRRVAKMCRGESLV